MKRLIYILFLVLISSIAFSQITERVACTDSSYLFYADDEGNLQLVFKYKYFYDFSHKVHIMTREWEVTDSSEKFVYERNYTYYDYENHIVSEIIFRRYDSELDSVINFRKYVYVHNDEGLKTERITYNWDKEHSEWVEYYKRIYVYADEDNLYDTILYYIYDTSSLSWSLTGRIIYYYDAAGFPDSLIFQNYTDTTGWVNSSKGIFEFNSLGFMTLRLFYAWRSQDNIWEKRFKYEAEYLNDSLLYRERFYDFDSTGNSFLTDSVYYYYDANYNLTNFIRNGNNYVFSYTTVSKNRVIFNRDVSYIYYWNYMKFLPNQMEIYYSTGELSQKIVFYTSEVMTGIQDIKQINRNVIKVFPNPATKQLFVLSLDPQNELYYITIFDASGKAVLRRDLRHEYIDVTSLKPGIYLYRIDGAVQQFSGKFVKQ